METPYRPIQFRGAKTRMEQDDMYFLCYPLEQYLLQYLTLGVIALNSRYNDSWQVNRPLSIVIGNRDTLNSFNQVLEIGQQFDRCGDIAYFSHITCDELTEFVYEKLLYSESPFVSISGFEKIWFSDEPAKELENLSLLLHNLKKLQNQFKMPVVLAGLTELKNGDNDLSLLPKFESKWGEIEVGTEACWNIPAPIGQLKLFKLIKTGIEVQRRH